MVFSSSSSSGMSLVASTTADTTALARLASSLHCLWLRFTPWEDSVFS